MKAHAGPVYGVALSSDGRLLASGSDDGTVRLRGPSDGRLLATLQGHVGAVRAVGLSADGWLLASGAMDGTVQLWETPFAPSEPREEFTEERSTDFGASPAAPPRGASPGRGDAMAVPSSGGGSWPRYMAA